MGNIKKVIIGIALIFAIYVFGLYGGYYIFVVSAPNPIQSDPVVNHSVVIDLQNVHEGMYRVGRDIPAGEYKLTENDDGKYGAFYEVTSDSTGLPDSRITNDNFGGHSFITVKDGEYIKTVRCYMEKIN